MQPGRPLRELVRECWNLDLIAEDYLRFLEEEMLKQGAAATPTMHVASSTHTSTVATASIRRRVSGQGRRRRCDT